MTIRAPEGRDIYSVTRLNREVRTVLEDGFPLIWLRGEISNLARPGSGHIYFSLKDDNAQVRCALFRGRNRLLPLRPQNGSEVIVRARISLYEGRGEYQLIIEGMEPAGAGARQQAFEELKQRLHAEGLFAAEHKQALPAFPACIGVITSATGAAIRDILIVLQRRYARAAVVIYPVAVQGEGAAGQIVKALRRANAQAECDVLLLARGGGSLEDLWAFNEESVARAIHASRLPVVSGIGHEIDISIADLAADQRAATPSAAAELVSPDGYALLVQLGTLAQKLHQGIGQLISGRRQLAGQLHKRLPHPQGHLEGLAQRTDDLGIRLQQAMAKALLNKKALLGEGSGTLKQHNPLQRLLACRQRGALLSRALCAQMENGMRARRERLQQLVHNLHTVSPRATLARGYAIVTDDMGRVVRRADAVRPGDAIHTRLGRGQLESVVNRVRRGRRSE